MVESREIRSLADVRALARARRRELGLTQTEAANRAGVSRQFVSYFERGEGGDLTTTLRLLTALDVTLLAVPGLASDPAEPYGNVSSVPIPTVVDLDRHLAAFDQRHRPQAHHDDRG